MIMMVIEYNLFLEGIFLREMFNDGLSSMQSGIEKNDPPAQAKRWLLWPEKSPGGMGELGDGMGDVMGIQVVF